MIGSLIGAGLGVVGSIFGGISAARKAREQREINERKQAENEDWYRRRYNEDPTQRASALRVLRQTEDAIKQRNREARGVSAVMGGSQDAVAAAQERNAQASADAASQIAAANDARKDQIEQQYQTRKDALDQQMQQIKAGEAQAIAQATQGVAGAGAGIAAAFDQPKTSAAKGDAAGQSLDKAAKAAEAAAAAGTKPITKEEDILDRLSSEDDIWKRGKVSLT